MTKSSVTADLVEIFSALANPVRLQIIQFLERGEKCVCEITPAMKKSQPTLSIHLNQLYRAGLIDRRRDGKKVFYKLKKKDLPQIFKRLRP